MVLLCMVESGCRVQMPRVSFSGPSYGRYQGRRGEGGGANDRTRTRESLDRQVLKFPSDVVA